MDLTCYLHEGWRPIIRPASPRRDWMDGSPDSFAYRCLPLDIANAHGWEVVNPHGLTATWNGGGRPEDVTVTPDPGYPAGEAPVALFGQGTITFHVAGLFRTPPGWNLFVTGTPNFHKDGIAPLAGMIETDWAPFTFTMNWRFTRPHHPVRFEAGEPFAFLMPVPRDAIEAVEPVFRPLAEAPELADQFRRWSEARDGFHATMAAAPAQGGDSWQKHYYRGIDMDGRPAPGHKAKLRVRPFAGGPPERRCPVIHPAPTPAPADPVVATLAKRDWLLDTIERQRALSERASGLFRLPAMAGDAFLDHLYAPARPAVLTGALDGWPALGWTAEGLAARIGGVEVEYQGGRDGADDYELDKHRHRRRGPFDRVVRAMAAEGGNDAYLTAFNAAANRDALAPLHADLGTLPDYLDGRAGQGMLWIGGTGSFTPLHHDLTNNLIAQLVGTKRVWLVPAGQVARLRNERAVFSAIHDLRRLPELAGADPQLSELRVYEVALAPGELLFVPIGWWHQLEAEDFSVSATFTNFRWPNGASADWPG